MGYQFLTGWRSNRWPISERVFAARAACEAPSPSRRLSWPSRSIFPRRGNPAAGGWFTHPWRAGRVRERATAPAVGGRGLVVFSIAGVPKDKGNADMPTAEFLRQKAQEVRALIALAKTPTVRAQLRLWARELEKDAVQAEATAATMPYPSAGDSSRGHSKRRRRAS